MTMMSKEEIIKMRKTLIERQFSHMNNMQKEAIFNVNGALLILAGAGSGKTTVIVNRISNILSWGNAYHSNFISESVTDDDITKLKNCYDNNTTPTKELISKFAVNPAKPWQIMAITFTNKAAKELKERISAKLNSDNTDIWASTFHSTCAKILRRYADILGYSQHFAIYDTDDSKKTIKDCYKALGITEHEYPLKETLNEISKAKNAGTSLEEFKKNSIGDSYMTSIAKVFDLYQKRLKKSDAMDFDDLLVNTVKLLRNNVEVREHYQNLFKYVMVDEYQDTNKIQYELIKLLSDKTKNLCVVGDDDQSIYKFRGATIENILNFEETYKDAKVIRLEQNYRSTKTILSAANSVIENNENRKGKTLWTDNSQGDLITTFTTFNEKEEADYIGTQIQNMVAKGKKYSDFAILYRTNTQSRMLEKVFVHSAIPHKIVGSLKFFDRKEIKDILAYLRVVNNNNDNEKLKRIINYPKRTIGVATVTAVETIAENLNVSMMEVLRNADQYIDAKTAPKLMEFASLIDEFTELYKSNSVNISNLYINIVEKIHFKAALKKDNSASESAVENVDELLSAIQQYEDENGEEATLSGFLDEIALMTDIDTYNNSSEEDNRVSMMTIHSAKGLEFPVVFLPGMEENLFPSFKSSRNPDDMQEERRLAYVALTRAKEKLFITNAQARVYMGVTNRNTPSRFIKEIPNELMTASKQQPIISEMSKAYAESPYEKRKQRIATARAFGPTITEATKTKITSTSQYSVGDMVLHKVFGKGMILSSKPMANDFLLEIAFDTVGTKKIMSNFSKLEKI